MNNISGKIATFWQALMARVFVERVIIIRQAEDMSQLTLSVRLQKGVAVVCCGMGFWLLTSSMASIYQFYKLERLNTDLAVVGDLVGQYRKNYDTHVDTAGSTQDFLQQYATLLGPDTSVNAQVPSFTGRLAQVSEQAQQQALKIADLQKSLDENVANTLHLRSMLAAKEREQEEMLTKATQQVTLESQTIAKQLQAALDEQQQLRQQMDAQARLVSSTTQNKKRLQDQHQQILIQLETTKNQAQQLALEKQELQHDIHQQERSLVFMQNKVANWSQKLAQQLNTKAEGAQPIEVMANLIALNEQETKLKNSQLDILQKQQASITNFIGRYGKNNIVPKDIKPQDLALMLDNIDNSITSQAAMIDQLTDLFGEELKQLHDIFKVADINPDDLPLANPLGATGQGGPLIMPVEMQGLGAELRARSSELNDGFLTLQLTKEKLQCLPMVSPVDYYHITSKYGPRRDPITKRNAFHAALDMGAWPGTPVWSPIAGKVTKAGRKGVYGKMIEIESACGTVTRYGHLKSIKVKVGDTVDYRQEIGSVGSTGRSTGPHLHYEVMVNDKHVDPANLLKAGIYVHKSESAG